MNLGDGCKTIHKRGRGVASPLPVSTTMVTEPVAPTVVVPQGDNAFGWYVDLTRDDLR